ncbi:MAG: lytic murein transglycosylase B [Polynucleobacter sp. 24-46-87]|jgi:membrane-bound lytic murein transglycosylase B|uniref:lytic murein transglycosylase B n=1 Tax=Polynucleobacter sp. 39-46-10 TaxID=1970428 RepID=UPI000BDD8675|nr:lytic murein transglycosylase B [Polynucleobacter sp. 39-46-10]OZA14967.1 MAG: lytic murein transglycosylase B [Polynucleobacter sp. 24-46-87]OZA77056.1 MAG: lytic murein transglycosylase B [Polynucleobacter sp. 39-46-10]
MNFRVSYLAPALSIALLLGACSTTPVQQASPAQTIVNQSEDAATEARFSQNLNQLITQIAQTQGIPQASLESGFSDTKTIPSIRKLVLPPSGSFKKNWVAYRKRFIEPVRLKAGKAFWEQNQTFLSKVEQESGVPAEVIVSIIGIETIYGRQTGNFRVKDVLSTLAFSYPDTPNKASREQLFKDQLQELILMCWTEGGGSLPAKNSSQGFNSTRFNACLNQNSSYAGAIGLPQFMPSSIRSFAVDGDGDGRIDLKQSPKDAIASVANFMRKHGWQPGMPIYFPVQNGAISEARALADGEPKLKYTIQDLITKGILTKEQGDLQAGGVEPQSKALIVDLPYPDKDGNDQVRYVVGLNNFLTIVQYNRSYFYAQSVAEFAEALGYKNQSTVPTPATKAKLETKSAEPAKSKAKKPANKKKQA